MLHVALPKISQIGNMPTVQEVVTKYKNKSIHMQTNAQIMSSTLMVQKKNNMIVSSRVMCVTGPPFKAK